MQSSDTYLNILHQSVYDLLVDLEDTFNLPSEKDDLTQIEFFYKKLHKERVLIYCQERLSPYKAQIKERKLSYFDKNIDLIFAGLEKDRVTYYRNIVMEKNKKKKRLTDEDFAVIWQYLDSMIASIEAYENMRKKEDPSYIVPTFLNK